MAYARRIPLCAALATGIAVAATAARADSIDGNWCFADGRRLSIEGPRIVIPSGKTIPGDYDRHGFRYQVPAGEPGAGTAVSMTLVNEDLVHLRRASASEAAPELWRRCGAPTS
ncbi:MAG: hypothetical protein AB7F67_22605 [Rhodospirillaceae bacterium]